MGKIFKIIFTSFIATFLIFLGVGYATVSLDFEVEHNVVGDTQEKVFITDFYPTSGATNEGTVNESSFIRSILTSDISLNSKTSEITYTVQVYNNADEDYCYIGTLYNTTLGYNNTNIDFKLSMIEGQWDSSKKDVSVVESKKYLTFTITFFYEGDGTDLSLDSVLNFQFMPLKDAQKVTLFYEGNSYVDVFSKDETVATFPDLHFDVIPTETANNVARCNLNAIPYYDETLKQIHVTGVDSAGNNENNEVKCEVYDSLGFALGDSSFEQENYTINNILVMNDIDATDYNIHKESDIPENKVFNVDMNNKNIYIDCVGYAFKLRNASKVYINNCKLLSCGGKVHSIFEMDNEDAELYINGGKFTHATTGNAIYPKKGKLIIRDAHIFSENGNIFRLGTTVSDEASNSNYNVHVEMIGGKAESTNANIVHSISRGKVLFSFVDVELSSGNNTILCNNDKNDSEPGKDAYDNVRFYITGGSIHCGNGNEFSTHGSYLFYTNNIKYSSSNTKKDIRGITGGTINISDFHYYAVKNYYTGETDGSNDEKWYLIKDINGNYVYSSNGRQMRVGDRITFNSVKDTSYNMGAVDSSYAEGSKLQTAEAKSIRTQRWMFLASADPGYYNIVPYYKPVMMIFIHVDASNVQSTGGNLTNLQSLSDLQTLPGGRFKIKCTIITDKEGNITDRYFSILNKVDAGWPKGTVLGKSFALDISNSTTMKAELIIQGYKDNDTAAQQWRFQKNNK